MTVTILLLMGLGSAQLRDRTEHKRADEGQSPTQNKKPAKRGPRAIAVIEFLPKGGARLVPIALWMDGRYYDASFYGANPEPLALEPETLYQALSYGEPTGWFTVTTPKQVNGTWIADGKWKPQQGTLDAKIAQQAAKQPKKKTSSINDDSGPPVLRRSPSSGSDEPEEASGSQNASSGSSNGTSTASSAGNAPPPSNDDSGRPTLKNSSPSDSESRPTLGSDASQTSTQTAVKPAPPADDDSDRPTLKNSSPSSPESRPTLEGDSSPANAQAATTPPPPAASSDENDPDRPVLHRGKPSNKPSAAAVPVPPLKGSASGSAVKAAAAQTPKAPAANGTARPGNAYPAISDAGNYEIRSLLYSMTPSEKEERGRPMLALALEELRNYRSKHQPIKAPGKAKAKAPVEAKNFVITDYDLRAFDLDFSNSPTLVLTARVPDPGVKAPAGREFDYFITIVARVDINGQAQKIFGSVTDDNHLDAFPRLEIIDAVDADANGRGDLLFREHSDTGVSYALFRVYPYQMVKVFEGGSNM